METRTSTISVYDHLFGRIHSTKTTPIASDIFHRLSVLDHLVSFSMDPYMETFKFAYARKINRDKLNFQLNQLKTMYPGSNMNVVLDTGYCLIIALNNKGVDLSIADV